MNTIGERIVFLREKKGISQKELARKIGITAASLSRYENNMYDPKGSIIISLSRQLETSADYLLGITADYHIPSRLSTVSKDDLHTLELYCALSSEDKIRITERILTLQELHSQ